MRHQICILLLCLCTLPAQASNELDAATAAQVLDAALQHAHAEQAPGAAIAVVDAGGHLLALTRLDGTFPAASAIAEGKARTAALFRKPTRLFEEIVNGGRTSMTALPAVTPFTPLKGGVPLVVAEQVVGAIGVSGAASADQDDAIAQAAADAVAHAALPASAAVTEFEADEVRRAFASNGSLFSDRRFKVNASRRDGPGEAEVHHVDTDIFYVQSGSARIVTGGRVIEPRTVAPGEIRGRALEGGEDHRLSAGDVIIVPRGVPHWFADVEAPFVYFVVKSSR